MKIEEKKTENKIILKVSLLERKKIDKIKVFNTSDAKNHIIKKFSLEKDQKLVLVSKPPHDLMNHTINLSGEWIFEIENKKPVDIKKKNVIIKSTNNKETKSEISKNVEVKKRTSSNNSKNTRSKATTARRKRTTRSKKTEE